MSAFVLAIFLSAFLLFQVQPIIARYILPWYGGAPSVWTTCMLFFQVGLLVGYGYAHLLVTAFRRKKRWQVGVHLALLAASCLVLPVTPSEALKPAGDAAAPVAGILALLLSSVGLPYVLISASGPLLQHWFAGAMPGRSPYRLYAVSNAGSLLALLSYPVLFEPAFQLGQQTLLWSGAFAGYIFLAAFCGWLFLKKSRKPGSAVGGESAEEDGEAERPPGVDRILWVALAACGSVLLLSTTNQMCQDVAAVPFLWVLPLSLYLVTFIISFDHARWYYRPVWVPLAAILVGIEVYLLRLDFANTDWHLGWQIATYSLSMFACCMVCHGEMVRLKPDPAHLTSFYLAVALGGALGGAFVSLLAPHLFNGYWELHVGLLITAALAAVCVIRDSRRARFRYALPVGIGVALAAIVVLAVNLIKHVEVALDGATVSSRSFFGVLRVYESGDTEEGRYRSLYHGRINHGLQFVDEASRDWPLTYYTEGSGPGVAFSHLRKLRKTGDGASAPLKVGVIGLGVGTLAAWAEKGDAFRFYEINPGVETLARSQFTYLEDCAGDVSVVLGDARINLEKECASGENPRFDLLFVDAFSGDSIPVHLLTTEAFELYFKSLAPNGVLMVHITNIHLDLSDLVQVAARDFGRKAARIEYNPDEWYENYSDWVMVTDDVPLLLSVEAGEVLQLLQSAETGEGASPWWTSEPKEIRWTDDYSNLLQVIIW